MKYVAAYALLVLAGNESPCKCLLHVSFRFLNSLSNRLLAVDAVTKLLKDSGVNPEADRVALVVKNLNGKPLNELIAAGLKKITVVSGNSFINFKPLQDPLPQPPLLLLPKLKKNLKKKLPK